MIRANVGVLARSGGGVALDIPTGLTAVSLSSSSISLTWTNGIKPQDGVKIERSLNAVDWQQIATSTSNTYTDSDLTLNYYYYRIKSYKGSSNSEYTSYVLNDMPLYLLGTHVKRLYDFTNASLKTLVGGAVQQVNDKSVNACHLTAPLTTQRPIDDGTDGVTGDGVNDALLNATATGINGNCSVFVVLKLNSWRASTALIQGVLSTHATEQRLRMLGFNPQNMEMPAPPLDAFALISMRSRNTGNSDIQIGNDIVISGSNTNMVPVMSFYGLPNYSNFYNSSFKEFILIDEVVSDQTKEDIKYYLNQKQNVSFFTSDNNTLTIDNDSLKIDKTL